MGVWKQFDEFSDEQRAALASLSPERRHQVLDEWHATCARMAQLRDRMRHTAAELDVLVNRALPDAMAESDPRRRELACRMLTITAFGAQGMRDFAEGVAPEDSPLTWYLDELNDSSQSREQH